MRFADESRGPVSLGLMDHVWEGRFRGNEGSSSNAGWVRGLAGRVGRAGWMMYISYRAIRDSFHNNASRSSSIEW